MATPTSAPPDAPQGIGVVSYFTPGALWGAIATPRVGLAIINPNSGPGTAKDDGYAQQVIRTQATGTTVLGYVATAYGGSHNGTRTLANVERDITNYFAWYPTLGGLFVDEVSADCATLASYYQPLYAFIKAHHSQATVVLNPGVATAPCALSAGDIVVEFDDAYANYAAWAGGGWEAQYPAWRFWHIIHDASEADMRQALPLAKRRNVGWIYVTNLTTPNPFGALPSYWHQEVALLG